MWCTGALLFLGDEHGSHMAASTVTLLLFLSAFALATPFRSRYDYTVWVLSISVLLLTTYFGQLLTDMKAAAAAPVQVALLA